MGICVEWPEYPVEYMQNIQYMWRISVTMKPIVFQQFTSLILSQLGCNHIGDEGVKAVALALISNAQSSGLIWLALGGNGLTDKGAEHLAIALKIQHSPTGLASRLAEEQGDKGNPQQVLYGTVKIRPDKQYFIATPTICQEWHAI